MNKPIATTRHWLDPEKQQDHLYQYSFKEIEHRLFHGSYVGDKRDYVFLATPKAACSTMKWILVDLENRHVPLRHFGLQTSREMIIHARPHDIKNLMQFSEDERLRLLNDGKVVRFCVVRNPYARIASAWSNKIRQKEPELRNSWQRIAEYFGTDPEICPSFPQFARWVVETAQADHCNNHWHSMAHLLLPELMRYTHILHTENLEAEFASVLKIIAPAKNAGDLLKKHRINESLPIDWQSYYDEETAQRVAQFYHEDFKQFGYALDSWKPSPQTLSLAEEVIHLRKQLARLENSALEAIRARNEVINDLCKKAPPTDETNVNNPYIVLVLGDSHARLFERENWLKLTPKMAWKSVIVEGATLSGLQNPNSQTQAAEHFKHALQQHPAKIILFCLGEVDTGFVIWYRAEKHHIDRQQATQQAIDNYCQLITLAQQKAKVVVLSTPLPTLRDGLAQGEVAKARLSVKANQQERTDLTRQFNAAIESWCNGHGVSYVNLDPLSVGPDGQVDPKLLHPNPLNHHYNPGYYQELLAEHLLPLIRKIMWNKAD
ncbi:MAG: sulfotransferase family 2 domain-containing protein [Methylovulum sp.]|uniref:sulfotransferase family 2 domain-containing protein n=1 Tax=Methylovulum sp. TaxID=1916980 RepID=UPI002621C2C8|nr:sulfotransferase family 2 domain-containing protein [Methylovulum sp.]MDD2724502.1 sulfotransferase family 2 domain-containing protein [Methylovulum sp.]MDD5124108.1 sulfotransferase family 2 domain-containing protein [Methylovulum sp.]